MLSFDPIGDSDSDHCLVGIASKMGCFILDHIAYNESHARSLSLKAKSAQCSLHVQIEISFKDV